MKKFAISTIGAVALALGLAGTALAAPPPVNPFKLKAAAGWDGSGHAPRTAHRADKMNRPNSWDGAGHLPRTPHVPKWTRQTAANECR
jgi:hypothetical protein